MDRRDLLLPLINKRKKKDEQGQKYQTVLEAWKNDDIITFTQNLDSSIFDHNYPEHNNLRLLDLIVAVKPTKLDFLREALKLQPNVNSFNTKIRYVAIHFAVAFGNFEAFWCLHNAGADVNVQDKDGDTILHYIVEKYGDNQQGYHELLLQVLKYGNVAVNVPNLQGITPIAMAAKKGIADLVQEFLNLGPAIDLDTFEDNNQQTARKIITEKLPEFVPNLPGKWHPDGRIIDYQYRLFYFLTGTSNQQLLQETITAAVQTPNLNKHELFQCIDAKGQTLLQNAVQKPNDEAMKLFIQHDADVNYTPFGTEPPIFLAARNKNLTCYCELLSDETLRIIRNTRNESLLHILVKNCNSSTHSKALRITLPHVNIHAKNINGQTALHLAVTHANEETIFRLLDNGARLDVPNNRGETPLHHLRPEIYENYLNSKITIKPDITPQDLKYTIFFDYKFMSSTNGTSHVHDISTKPLEAILRSKQHKKFLAHPVIATILFFKWKKIRWLFYFYLLFSILFCIFFTTFLYFGPKCTSSSTKIFMYIVEALLWIYLISRALWEIIDLFFSPKTYINSTENYLQISMIISSLLCIFYNCQEKNSNFCKSISAFAMLFTWIELFFIIGKHPKTNSFTGMFRKASWFLLQFLAVHTALILAFVFSFHVMFRDEPGQFESIPHALFKTIVMVSGEYEVGDVPFDSLPGVSHVLFVLFLFLVAIVLFNLLIGLAVSATRPIEEDAFLYRCIAQVPIVSFIERVFFHNFYKVMEKFIPKVVGSKLHPVLALRPNKLRKQMKIFLKEKKEEKKSVVGDTIHSVISFPTKNVDIRVCHVLSKRIVDDAQNIIAKGDPFVIEQKIETLQSQLEIIKTTLEKLQIKLDGS